MYHAYKISSMKKWWILGGIVIVGVPLAVIGISYLSASLSYQEQLRLARSEGIPTSGAEFAAMITSVPDSQNAAHSYHWLKEGTYTRKLYEETLAAEVVFRPSDRARNLATGLLNANKKRIDAFDLATQRPHLRIKFDWSGWGLDLELVLFSIRDTARFLFMRGALAAAASRTREAVADVHKVLKAAAHLKEIPSVYAHSAGLQLEHHAFQNLAHWAVRYPSVRVYRDELAKAIDSVPLPDLKAAHRHDLIDVLAVIELLQTPAGRYGLGLDESDAVPAAPNLFLAQPPDRGRAMIVKATREYWAALDQPNGMRSQLLKRAVARRIEGYKPFPTAYKYLSDESSHFNDTIDEVQLEVAHRQLYRGLLRALEAPITPSSIKTENLLSPFDGEPLQYRFDGRQIVIEVSTPKHGTDEQRLMIPPRLRPN